MASYNKITSFKHTLVNSSFSNVISGCNGSIYVSMDKSDIYVVFILILLLRSYKEIDKCR